MTRLGRATWAAKVNPFNNLGSPPKGTAVRADWPGHQALIDPTLDGTGANANQIGNDLDTDQKAGAVPLAWVD